MACETSSTSPQNMNYRFIDATLYRTLEDAPSKRYKMVKQHIFCPEHKFDLSEDGQFLDHCDKPPYPTLHQLFLEPDNKTNDSFTGSDKRLVPSYPDEPEFIPLFIPECRINELLLAYKMSRHNNQYAKLGFLLSDLIQGFFASLPVLAFVSNDKNNINNESSSSSIHGFVYRTFEIAPFMQTILKEHVFIPAQPKCLGLDISNQDANLVRMPFPFETIQQSSRSSLRSIQDAKLLNVNRPIPKQPDSDFFPVSIPKPILEKLIALDLEFQSDDTIQRRAKACKLEMQSIISHLFLTWNIKW